MKRTFRYRLFTWYVKFKLIKEILKGYEWDHAYLFKLIERKLTGMGLYFQKYGIALDKKDQVRSIWKARHALRQYLNAENILIEKADTAMKKLYGFIPELEFITEPYIDKESGEELVEWKGTRIKGKSDAESKKILKEHHKIYNIRKVDDFQKKKLKEALDIIYKEHGGWWD